MLRNYLKIALRNLSKHKGYAFINVVGLAIGLACCLLITLYVKYELGYDRYHEKAERIYRLTTEAGISGRITHFSGAASPMAAVMRAEFPEVEQATRVWNGSEIVRVGDRRFKEDRYYWADSTVFDVFSFVFVKGNAETALDRPYTVVLTQSTARKYFGSENPIGKVLRVGDVTDVTVTGVIEGMPDQSHFHADFLASMSSLPWARGDEWLSNINFKTYLVLREGASPEALTAKFPELIQRNVGDVMQQLGGIFRFELQPLTQIHLHSDLEYEFEPNSDISHVYIFSAVALFILLIACINFMNLATARSVDRAKEVGMRKVMGAQRGQLIRQFLTEAMLLALVAFFLALVLAELVLPAFSHVAGRELELDLTENGSALAVFVGITLLVGFLSGSYPALFLSGFRPVLVLKGKFKTSMTGVALRKGLVVTQFAISIALIVGTLVVQQQLDYARSQQLGFNKEQVIVLRLLQNNASSARAQALKAEVQRHPDVVSASLANHFPGTSLDDQIYFPEGRGMDEGIHIRIYRVDSDYLETLGMELVEGRAFSPAQPTDSSAVILNQTAMEMLGWDSIKDKAFVELGGPSMKDARRTLPVIGAVEDFHFESFHHDIRPLAIRIAEGQPGYLLVRARAGRAQEVLAFLREKWEVAALASPFEYSFLDERFDELYRADERLGRIFGGFAALAIIIACLGLFGLATFAVEQRTKEIGIRKVLGASVPGIVALLSKDFLKLVLLALVIASPAAYFLMNRWLEDFAYRIEIGPGIFLLAGAAALLIALATVSYQAIKAALSDPVKSLRYE